MRSILFLSLLSYLLLFEGCISESQLDVGAKFHEYDTSDSICPYNSFFYGKTIWTIWDSLGDGSNWQPLFVELSGAIYYSELNDRNLSFGGTNSNPASLNGTQARCKKLVGLKDKYPIDVVFLENINDMSYSEPEKGIGGTLMDTPFMMGERIMGHIGAFPCYEIAKHYIESKLDSIVESVPITKRRNGAMLSIPYKDKNVRGYSIEVFSSAVNDGDLLVKIGGNIVRIPVKTDMGVEDILHSLLWGGYNPGWSIVDNGNKTLTLSFYTNTDSEVSIDENGTGIQLNISDDKASREFVVYYLGHSSSDWCSVDKWAMDLSLYSIYKGTIEYLKKELPMTRLFWVIPSYFDVNCNDPTLLDEYGHFSKEKYMETESYKKWSYLCQVQEKVCKFYSIPVLDISEKSGININNFLEYYNCGDAHPLMEGYFRWAETLYDIFKYKE